MHQLILTTIHNHLDTRIAKPPIVITLLSGRRESPYIRIHLPPIPGYSSKIPGFCSKIIYITINNDNCQINYWQDIAGQNITTEYHKIPLADPNFYDKITQHLRKILQ